MRDAAYYCDVSLLPPFIHLPSIFHYYFFFFDISSFFIFTPDIIILPAFCAMMHF